MSGKLKEVRERIESVRSTQQITKAMKMVSAAKLRKAQQAITEMRPYADRLNRMMKNILNNLEGDQASAFSDERDIKRMAIVVITSNRGLAGAFNTNIGKETLKILEEHQELADEGKVDIVFLGKKGFDFLKRRLEKGELNRDFLTITNEPAFDNIAQVSNQLMNDFTAGKYDKIYVVYSHFINAAYQRPLGVQYLPVPKPDTVKTETRSFVANYIFEPSKKELLESLIPSILQTTFHKFVLDTLASEHGARMTAMDKATENANELLKDLKISYNKARQETITNEILEIVGGAAALEN